MAKTTPAAAACVSEEPLTALKQCRQGRMLFLRQDRCVGQSLDLYGEFSDGESRLFAALVRPGDVVIEAGANIGAHTVQLARLAGPGGAVFAFEPQRIPFQLLCANLLLNEMFNVRTYHAAAGREHGSTCVPRLDHTCANSFGAVTLLGVTEGEVVPIIALDSLDLPSLRLLKAEVEGMETDVLIGARQLIARHQPILYVENLSEEVPSKLIQTIEEFDYKMWWHIPPLFNKNKYYSNKDDIFGNICSANMLCVPRSWSISISGLLEVSGLMDTWRMASERRRNRPDFQRP